MRTALAVMLAASLAHADPALPVCTDGVVSEAPDLPGVSVRVAEGEPAPFAGRLLSLRENCERGKATASCRAELADAKESAWLSKPVLIAVLVGAVLAGAAVGVAATYAVTAKR